MTPNLELRIREAATWLTQVNPALAHNFFRSDALRPAAKIRLGATLATTSWAAVPELINRRRRALRAAGVPLLPLAEALAVGRLVWASPSESVLDGAPELCSQGLVDIWEIPGWDTWLTVGGTEFSEFNAYAEQLICWIPEPVYDLFCSAVEVAIVGNLGWVTQVSADAGLAGSAQVPASLRFVEMTDPEREAMLRQLEPLADKEVVEDKKTVAWARTTNAAQPEPPVPTIVDAWWHRLTRWLS